MAADLASLIRKHQKRAEAPASPPLLAPITTVLPDDGESYVPVGTKGVLAATSKLLAVNRGLTPVDDRDSWAFKRVMTPDKLMAERVRLDASKARGTAVRRASKQRSLKGVFPFAFDNDVRGLLVGNPLSSPLEEINPMALAEAARRVTMMGPGGIGSDQAITPSMQAIHASQFGYISGLEGPESERAGVDARLSWGVRIGSDGRLYQRLKNNKTGRMTWLSPADLEGRVVGLPR